MARCCAPCSSDKQWKEKLRLITFLTEASSIAGLTFATVWSDADATVLTRKLADSYTQATNIYPVTVK